LETGIFDGALRNDQDGRGLFFDSSFNDGLGGFKVLNAECAAGLLARFRGLPVPLSEYERHY